MALLIMGIGVVSVFTLFPISVLRSIQATQQTNAKIHKQNTTELILTEALPLLNVNSPPRPATPGFRGAWSRSTVYNVGDIVVPSAKSGSPFPTPHLWFVCVETTDSARSGVVEPDWNPNGNTIDNDVRWLHRVPILGPGNPPLAVIQTNQFGVPHNDPLNPDPSLPVFRTLRYVVDPLGWNLAIADGSMPPMEFGNKTDTTTAQGSSVWVSGSISTSPLLRINGTLNSEDLAAANTTLLDSWETVVEATPLSVIDAGGGSDGRVTFPPSVDLSGTGGVRRITLTSTDGGMTVTRPVRQASGNIAEFPQTLPLPARFPTDSSTGDPDVGLAKLETFNRRYTWFLTVKKDAAGNADVKVVVVFNRRFLPEEEHVYFANFGNPNLDIDGDGNPDVASGSQVRIIWNAGAPDFEPEPLLKPGNFLFDARNVEWYRIQNVQEGTNTALLTLDRTVTRTVDTDADGSPDPGWGRAILMRGIVDVFDL